MGHLDEDASPLFSKGLSIPLKASLFVLASLGLMFADNRYDILNPIRAGLGMISAPVQKLAELPMGINGMMRYFASRDALATQNEALRREQLILEARLQKLVALEAENRRIRALLQSARMLEDRMLIAEILSVSLDPYRQHIKLNKGSQHGVFVGQALVDAKGIMGQIVEVGLRSSTALLITDPNHGIPVEVARNGLRTVAHGTGSGPGLNLPYLPSNADIQVGDELYSSGLGGIFPPGYPVGTVIKVSHEPGEHFLTITAGTAAHMDRGREVLLVWHTEEPAAVTPKPAEPELPQPAPQKIQPQRP